MVINEIEQHYSNHPSILQTWENFDNSQTVEQFQFNSVTTPKISELFKNIDDKNATGTDKIPPKLVKISAEVLSQPLADAINNSISEGIFPANAKIASVSPRHYIFLMDVSLILIFITSYYLYFKLLRILLSM